MDTFYWCKKFKTFRLAHDECMEEPEIILEDEILPEPVIKKIIKKIRKKKMIPPPEPPITAIPEAVYIEPPIAEIEELIPELTPEEKVAIRKAELQREIDELEAV